MTGSNMHKKFSSKYRESETSLGNAETNSNRRIFLHVEASVNDFRIHLSGKKKQNWFLGLLKYQGHYSLIVIEEKKQRDNKNK